MLPTNNKITLLSTPNNDRLQEVQVESDKLNCKMLNLFMSTGFINQYLIEDATPLNVSTEPLKTMDCGSRVQSDIVIQLRIHDRSIRNRNIQRTREQDIETDNAEQTVKRYGP